MWISWLKVQYKKFQKNYAIIKELMERSFSFRRIEVLDNSLSLQEMLEKFPFLQEIDMVSNFCYRVCEAIIIFCFHLVDDWDGVHYKIQDLEGELFETVGIKEGQYSGTSKIRILTTFQQVFFSFSYWRW